MKNYKNILIIGASGYLGNYVFNSLELQDDYDVYGTYNNEEKIKLIKCNVLLKDDIDKILSMKFDVIIWAVMNQLDETNVSNIGLKYLIAKLSSDVRFIYVSTTIGTGASQDENVKPHIRNKDEYLHEYVNGKILGESIIKEHDNYVIVRPGSIYGFHYNGSMDSRMKMLNNKYLSRCKYQRTANLYGSFVNVEDLTKAIIELITLDFKGIINICESDSISHYKFNKCLAKMMNISDQFIVPNYKSDPTYHTLSSELRKNLLKTQIRDIKDNLL